MSETGQLIQVLSLPPSRAFRARTRGLTRDETDPRQRTRYYRWLAEASILFAPVALGTQALGIMKMELGGDGAGLPLWFVDVYDSSGRPLNLDQPLPLSGRHLLGLRGLTSETFEAVEVSKDFLEPGSEHRWTRIRLR